MIEANFEVTGANYWELDREALRILDSLIGSLIDQRAEYSIRCSPMVETVQDGPVLWRGEVHAEVHGIPVFVEFNKTHSNRKQPPV